MIKRISKLTENESGQGMAEYGLIIALIAVVCVAAVTFLGVSIQDKFQFLGQEIESAAPGSGGGF
jgi:pilus assembly protein Flp/PilA